MGLIKKIIRKIKEGFLKEIFRELLWIYSYGLHYKGSILWYMMLGVIGIGVSLFASILTKYIIDAVTGYQFDKLIPLGVIYIMMQIMLIVSGAWTGRISAKIEIKVDQEIRADVYDKIMDTSWEHVRQYHSGDLLNRLNSDVSSVAGSVLGWIPSLVTRSIQFLGTLGVILYFDPTLAVLALLSAPVTFTVSYFLMRRMRFYNKKMRQISSDMISFQGESLRNIQTIKSFGWTGLYGKKLRDIQGTYQEERLNYNKFSIGTSTFMSFVGTAVSIVCFGWGVYRLWSGHISYGTLTLFLQLSSSLSGAFTALVNMVPAAISAATAAGRIMAVTELPKETYTNEDQVRELMTQDRGITITMKDVTFQYDSGKTVFEGIDFVANPGEIVAIIGPSGEGKTTLLRILLGLLTVQKGTVTVSEIPISAATRKLFSYVPQNNMLFSGTIAENMRMMKPDASEEEIHVALSIACADKFVEQIPGQLQGVVKEQGGGLSEGQIQRLSIARAMLSKAPVLLLDEATSALDMDTEEELLRNIIKGDNTRTCIVTTHRMSVLSMCDHIYKITGNKLEKVR